MADPTVEQCLSDAAAMLGDPGQEQFTNGVLLPWFGFAYREAYDVFQRWRLPMAQREAVVTIPANTASITPAALGINDMAEPVELWSRLPGSTDWAPVGAVDVLSSDATVQALEAWAWRNNQFLFQPCTISVQAKIVYTADGNPPSTGNVGMNDSRNFLALRTASLAAAIYDMPARAGQLKAEALGPSGDPDGTGGALRGLVGPKLLEKQNVVKRARAFRPRRNGLWW